MPPVRKTGLRALIVLVLLARAAAAEPYPLRIATGGVTGVYYQIGAAICRLLVADGAAHGIGCTTESSRGSVHNLTALRFLGTPLAVVQSDIQHQAVTGTGPFAGVGPDPELRALLAILPEPFTILARAGSGVRTLADLEGRKVNLGSFGSGTRATATQLLAAAGLAPADLQPADIRTSLQAGALCRGEVDALVFVGAHPSGTLQEATAGCPARFVPLDPAMVASITASFPYYRPAVIPGGLYPGNPEPVPTVAVHATLVAAAGVPDEVVHTVVRTILEGLPELRRLHPAFVRLDGAAMVATCQTAALHPNALRYFRAAGLAGTVCGER